MKKTSTRLIRTIIHFSFVLSQISLAFYQVYLFFMHQHLQNQISTVKLHMKCVLIVHLFIVGDVNIFFKKLGQSQRSLTQDEVKVKYISNRVYSKRQHSSNTVKAAIEHSHCRSASFTYHGLQDATLTARSCHNIMRYSYSYSAFFAEVIYYKQ